MLLKRRTKYANEIVVKTCQGEKNSEKEVATKVINRLEELGQKMNLNVFLNGSDIRR